MPPITNRISVLYRLFSGNIIGVLVFRWKENTVDTDVSIKCLHWNPNEGKWVQIRMDLSSDLWKDYRISDGGGQVCYRRASRDYWNETVNERGWNAKHGGVETHELSEALMLQEILDVFLP